MSARRFGLGLAGKIVRGAGFGLIAEAKSGIMQMIGTPGEAPPLLRISLGDMYTGIHAVAAINAALLGRVTSGKGQHIDMALYDCLFEEEDHEGGGGSGGESKVRCDCMSL